jgi:hypothetical protein
MRVCSALRRAAGVLYRNYLESNAILAVRGRPSLDVSEVRTHEEYRRCRDAMAATHTRWLRSVWFAETTKRDRLRGYCAICRAWTRFVINRERCYEVDGHSIRGGARRSDARGAP